MSGLFHDCRACTGLRALQPCSRQGRAGSVLSLSEGIALFQGLPWGVRSPVQPRAPGVQRGPCCQLGWPTGTAPTDPEVSGLLCEPHPSPLLPSPQPCPVLTSPGSHPTLRVSGTQPPAKPRLSVEVTSACLVLTTCPLRWVAQRSAAAALSCPAPLGHVGMGGWREVQAQAAGDPSPPHLLGPLCGRSWSSGWCRNPAAKFRPMIALCSFG